MKKILAWVLFFTLLAVSASAQTIAVRTEDGTTYLSGDGIYRISPEGLCSQGLSGSEIVSMGIIQDSVVYVRSVPLAEDDYSFEDTLCVIRPNGKSYILGEKLPRNVETVYSANYSYITRSTTYAGYTDMCVDGDYIYYIGNDGIPGTYTMSVSNFWNDTKTVREGDVITQEIGYDSGLCVYRLSLDDAQPVRLITGLGNSGAHLSVRNGVIAVASCFRNALYAYDFTNFMLYDTDGNLLETFPNNTEARHESMYMEDCEFTVITDRITTDGETIYASLSDSEGSFASSRYVDVRNIDETLIYEAFFAPSVRCGAGVLFLTSDIQDTFWDEGIEETLTLRLRPADAEEDRMLAYIPSEFADGEITLDVLEDTAYIRLGGRILRVPLAGGNVEQFDGNGFTVNPACAPSNYKPL